MRSKSEICNIIQKGVYGFVLPDQVLEKWNEPHRHFHNQDHLFSILDKIISCSETLDYVMVYAAIYHDIVYDPYRDDNEEQSIRYMEKMIQQFPTSITSGTPGFVGLVASLIIGTKDPKNRGPFNMMDRSILYSANVAELISYGQKIWKEYNKYSWTAFKKGHIKVICDCLGASLDEIHEESPVLNQYFDWLEEHKPSIAVYPGSFSPLHIGHKYVADEAAKVFDKVILAPGINPDKKVVDSSAIWKGKIDHPSIAYQVEPFSGLLTDYVKSLEKDGYNVTVIKGIRNSTDMEYEMRQEQWLRRIYPGIKIQYILTAPHLAHISSSSLKVLVPMGVDTSDYEW